MKRNVTMSLILAGAVAMSAGSTLAQRHGPGGPPPFGEPMELMGFEGMHGGKIVKGAPFSATATSERTQTLQDGTVIRHTSQVSLFRDGQGRSRHELTFSGFGALGGGERGSSHKMVAISDPVAGTHFMLDADNKVAHQTRAHVKNPDREAAFEQKMQARIQQEEAAGTRKTESLGTQTINGVLAEGTRITRTIPAGKIGNDKAIQIVSERWFSPDLQIVVKSTKTDPQFGTSTYTVTNLQKSEPAASLFAVPSDFTVQQGGPGARGRRGGSPQGPPPPEEN
jgi:hypothetical protein